MIIMAVDDEPKVLSLLVRILKKVRPEAEIHDFTRVSEALDFARQADVNVAFLDIDMPEMSGIQLARKLKEIRPYLNIIFATGYSEYTMDAIRLHCSGYLLKPVSRKDVETELENLRHPIVEEPKHRISVKTFGSFDIFVNGKPMAFHKERAKEILAFLIDKQGSTATRKEIAGALFEDKEYTRSSQAYMTNIFSSLRKSLTEYEIADLLVESYNTYSINMDMFECDAFKYMEGDPNAINQFHGEYMLQYSWAEDRVYQFYL